MEFLYQNKYEYLFHTQKDKIAFTKNQVLSQLHSVQKRSLSLTHDLWIYLLFVTVPIVLSFLSFVFSLFGNLILRIIFVPLLFVSAGCLLLLTPYGLYKICMGGLMVLFSRFGGSMTIFGNYVTVYTYKTEENFCLGKLKKLEDYEKQLATWEYQYERKEDLPDYPYMENVCENMELDFKIKVATLDDPILKHFGKLFFILFFILLVLFTIAIWSVIFLSMGKMLSAPLAGIVTAQSLI